MPDIPPGPAAPLLIDIPGKLGDQAELLGVALGRWAYRDDTKPEPEVRLAATTSMSAIDLMLFMLHEVRCQLVTEIRASDDAAMERAGGLLAEIRDRPAGGTATGAPRSAAAATRPGARHDR